jgi:hypothetical protein
MLKGIITIIITAFICLIPALAFMQSQTQVHITDETFTASYDFGMTATIELNEDNAGTTCKSCITNGTMYLELCLTACQMVDGVVMVY